MAVAMTKNGDTPVKAIDVSNFNKAVRPQDDFFDYVNGLWLKNNPIPATETSWGNFNILAEKSQKALRQICEEAAADKNAAAGSNTQKIGDFWLSGMDSVSIDKEKFTPLNEHFALINSMNNNNEMHKVLSSLHGLQIGGGFGLFIMADLKNSTTNVAYIGQSGMGLPEKDFYLNDQMKMFRDEYEKHVTTMFTLMGDEPKTAASNAKAVLEIETEFAKASMSAVEQRDAEKQYNKMSIAELNNLAPNFKWKEYLYAIGLGDLQEIIVTQPDFIKKFNEQVKTRPAADWKAYYRWHLVHSLAGFLHKDVTDENFRFYGQVMSGAKKQQPRWKKVLRTTEGALGEAMGEIYVKRHFSEESKKRVNIMVDNLTGAYEERIKTRDWMSEQTKQQALTKLKSIMRKLGFPDKWRDYSGLKVGKTSFVKNVLASNKFDFDFMISKNGKPVDRMEWGMTPATINAYYNPSNNEIVFPAGIMQPPFFNPDADDAVNYGAMGAVIGHELTHGFDDEGSHFDAEGNMVDWWTPEDKKKFEEKTKKLADQFNAFVVIDSINLHVNGELTLGENIADLGGLTIAYYAYKRSLIGKKAPAKIDGFTGEQRFFISWAQAWRNQMRTNALINMVKTNPHSPAKFRVLGPLSNMNEFYEAFGVKEKDKMYRKPEDRVQIW
ncbi:MAG: M13 family peptidase [Bacteroidia bacterium]